MAAITVLKLKLVLTCPNTFLFRGFLLLELPGSFGVFTALLLAPSLRRIGREQPE